MMVSDLTRTEIEALIARLEGIAFTVDHPASMIGVAYDRAQLPADAVKAARALRQLLGASDRAHNPAVQVTERDLPPFAFDEDRDQDV